MSISNRLSHLILTLKKSPRHLPIERCVVHHWKNMLVKSWNKSRKIRAPCRVDESNLGRQVDHKEPYWQFEVLFFLTLFEFGVVWCGWDSRLVYINARAVATRKTRRWMHQLAERLASCRGARWLLSATKQKKPSWSYSRKTSPLASIANAMHPRRPLWSPYVDTEKQPYNCPSQQFVDPTHARTHAHETNQPHYIAYDSPILLHASNRRRRAAGPIDHPPSTSTTDWSMHAGAPCPSMQHACR